MEMILWREFSLTHGINSVFESAFSRLKDFLFYPVPADIGAIFLAVPALILTVWSGLIILHTRRNRVKGLEPALARFFGIVSVVFWILSMSLSLSEEPIDLWSAITCAIIFWFSWDVFSWWSQEKRNPAV